MDVDLLEFDRDERWEEMKQLKSMIALSNGYETYAYKLVEKNSGENPERELTAAKLGLIPRILERESRVTKKAAEKEYQYALDFKLHAAYTLVTVLSRVYVVASYSTTFGLAKACFKVFRMPVLKKKSVYLRNRAIMKNYIRICKRQTSLSQNIHIYYRLRTMWAAYNRWLKLIELSYLDTSPGLLLYLKRAASMFLDYDRTLKSHGFKVQEYPRSSPLLGFSLEVPQLFHRWKMFAQESKLFKLLDKRAAVIYNCRLLKKVFHIIRYRSRDSLSSSSSSHFSDIESPVYIRCLNDFDQMMKRFVCIRRLTIYRKILLLNRQYRAAIMHSGRKILTFKGFIRRLHDDVNERISTELGVLSEAFENRGAIGFIDITDTLKVPDLMLRLHGTHFSDPLVSPPNETASLPGGYLLSSVHICLQEMSGIVGWQLVWRAGTSFPRCSTLI